MKIIKIFATLLMLAPLMVSAGSHDDSSDDNNSRRPRACRDLPTYQELRDALGNANALDTSGLDNQSWGAIVSRDGVVCAVAFTGDALGDQWPGSRAIAGQKANTANSYSLPGVAVSTALLYAPTDQPSAANPIGGNFKGLQFSNPVNPKVAYRGPSRRWGTAHDPMVGRRIGGVNVFGGGLALYDSEGTLLGGLGVSGDTSCADHNVAWLTRQELLLDYVPPIALLSGDATRPDNIVIDAFNGDGDGKTNGFEQADCPFSTDPTALPVVRIVN